MNNANRGKTFEKLVTTLLSEYNPDLTFKHIDRSLKQYDSLPDIECVELPFLKIDTKFTEGNFTLNEKIKLILTTYGKYGNLVIVPFGEKLGGRKLYVDNILCGLILKSSIIFVPLSDVIKFVQENIQLWESIL